jgi:hypothetical protein
MESMNSMESADYDYEGNFQAMSLDTSRGGGGARGRARGRARAKSGGGRHTALPAAPIVNLRSYFPETWLFELVLSDQQGKFKRFLSFLSSEFCPVIFVQ